PISGFVCVELWTRKDLRPGSGQLLQVSRRAGGVHSRFEPYEAEVDDRRAALRKQPRKICCAGQSYPEPHEARPQSILPADRHLGIVKLDDPARVERTEEWPGCAVDQHSVDPREHGGLPIDAVGNENVARGIVANRKNVRPQIPLATLPFGNSEIE